MAGFLTVNGFAHLLSKFQDVAAPTNYYLALITDVVVPTVDTATLGELDEIVAGNGYTAGGIQLTPGLTDFPTLTKDYVNNRAQLLLADIVFSASGGSIPDSGNPAVRAVLTDDNATPADREVLVVFDLNGERVVQDTFDLTLDDPIIRHRGV